MTVSTSGVGTPRMSDKVFTLGSLFSGIGGLELGLEMTGRFQTVWQVENNEYCRKVLARHWPNAQRFEDVRNVGKENLPAVDVICGGFPCQDVSLANNFSPKGLDGGRSGLWREFARIVRELRPRYVIVENTPGLLVRGIGRVLGELAALRYDAEWTTLSVCAVGGAHMRKRVFILAHTDHFTRLQAGPPPRAFGGERYPRHHAGRSNWGEVPAPNWQVPEAVSVGMANGVPSRVDGLTALGNAVVPQCAKVIGEWLLEIDAHFKRSTR